MILSRLMRRFKMKSEYIILEQDQQAKRATYENKIGQKTISFPNVSFYLRSMNQIKQFKHYVKTFNYSHNLRGLVFPIDRADLQENFKKSYKRTTLIMFDPLTEIFYYGGYKKEIYNQYSKIEGLPIEVIKFLEYPNKTQNWAKKDDEYKQELNLILSDAGIRTKLIEAIVNKNLKNDCDIIIPFAPLIKNNSSFFICKQIYDQTRRMFLGGLTDIDESLGKRIALYLNIHKSALSDSYLIKNIIDFIKNNEHQALVLKILISDNSSIKNLSYFEVMNLRSLLRTIGLYSQLNRIPTHLLCSNSLGLIGISHGIDSFSQPLNRHERELEMGFSKEQQEKMKKKDPYYPYGSIYCNEIRDFIKYSNYCGVVKANGFQLPSPARAYSDTIQPTKILDMNKWEFYEHARMTLLENRNYEIDEILKAINQKEIRGYKSRFKNFFNNILLPQ